MASKSTPELPAVSNAQDSVLIAASGDTHFRDSQYARASRGRDYFDAKVRLVEETAKRGIQILLDSGDFFNSARPSANVIQMATKLNALLKQRRIAMLTVTGNHDWSTPTWLQVLFPDADPDDFGIVPMDDRRVVVDGVVYQGIRPYTPSGYRENEKVIKAMCEGADVIVMHATVNGIVECGVQPDRMLDLSELPFVKGVKLILLGDLHYFGFTTHRGVLVGYPGSSEMNSSSEPIHKVLPLIRISAREAIIEEAVPLTIRPFFAPVIRNEEDADMLMAALKPVAAQHPVVIAKFSREVPTALARTYSLLDPQRSIIRFAPLPSKEEAPEERHRAEEIDAHGIEYFLHARFGGEDHKDELALSLDLLARGESDAANILTAYIAQRQQDLAIRENTPTDT